ncbi:ubiquinone biosynthesis protein [Malassezia pachydermatis]
MAVVTQAIISLGEAVLLPRRIVPHTSQPWPTKRTPETQASAPAPQQPMRSTVAMPPTEEHRTTVRTDEEPPSMVHTASTPPASQTTSTPAAEVPIHDARPGQPEQPVQTVQPMPTVSATPSTVPTPAHATSDTPPLPLEEYDATNERTKPLRATRVPSSRIGRLLHYGSLGAGLAWGSASEYMRRATTSSEAEGAAAPVFLSARNVDRLVDKLSTMRGAALKLGQFLSIQDSHMLPPQVEEVLLRVQDTAHYMPQWQLERVMTQELGEDWRSNFASFDERPFAAASIGQVHSAVLADPFPSQPHLAGQRVAVKVQFPGVADSISSDLSNIKWLFLASSLLPKGLFLENSVRVLQQELQDECDYEREAEMGRRFREHLQASKKHDGNESLPFEAPDIVSALSTKRVLTTEFMRGRPLTQASRLDQATRDRIASAIMELSLRELFDWHLMQTDPNWTNFLYHEGRQTIQLIDFGATRPYTDHFIRMWLGLLRAAVSGDRELCEQWSIDIGYLTGEESEAMRTAHVDSMLALGEPFRADAPVPYPFAKQTITDRVREQIPLMLRERQRPPPPETYSLNRKLSGAFLLCSRLGASVNCRDLFAKVTAPYPPSVPSARLYTQARRRA